MLETLSIFSIIKATILVLLITLCIKNFAFSKFLYSNLKIHSNNMNFDSYKKRLLFLLTIALISNACYFLKSTLKPLKSFLESSNSYVSQFNLDLYIILILLFLSLIKPKKEITPQAMIIMVLAITTIAILIFNTVLNTFCNI